MYGHAHVYVIKYHCLRSFSTGTSTYRPSIMHRVICKYANTMRANILYVASTWRKERSRQKKTRAKQRRRRTGRERTGGEKGKKQREKNGQSLDGSGCRAGIALHAGLKTSARNIATAKALICNLLPLPSAFYRATFPRMRRWNGTPKRSKDNTVKTPRLSPQRSTRDDTLLKNTPVIAQSSLSLAKLSLSIFTEKRPISSLFRRETASMWQKHRDRVTCAIFVKSVRACIFQT